MAARRGKFVGAAGGAGLGGGVRDERGPDVPPPVLRRHRQEPEVRELPLALLAPLRGAPAPRGVLAPEDLLAPVEDPQQRRQRRLPLRRLGLRLLRERGLLGGGAAGGLLEDLLDVLVHVLEREDP